MHDQFRTAFVRKSHTDAGILHGTCNSRSSRIALIDIFYCKERLFQRCGAVCNLSVRQYFTRLDSIAVADLPRGDSDFLCQKIDIGLQSEFTLAHAEPPESSGRRIICIISVSPDIRILVTVRAYRVGACSLENRSAQRCVRPCVEVYFTVQSREDTVLITPEGKCSFHGMAFRMEVDGLLSGKCDFDRPVYFQRRKRRDVLGRYVFLPAESAAYQLILHHNPLRIPAEHDRDFLSCVIDPLIG